MRTSECDPFLGEQELAGAFTVDRETERATDTAGAWRAQFASASRAQFSGASRLETPAELAARFNAELLAEEAALEAAGALVVPDDLFGPDDPEWADGPRFLSEEDFFDTDSYPMSRVDVLEWELWAGAEQDEAERVMLRDKAPAWVFLAPGAELAAALEPVRPECESPIALIEVMKAAARMVAWGESIKAAAMASFYRQRKAEAVEMPRPSAIDSAGRPIDPERSWAAEIGAALHLSKDTAARHIDTALHLTGPLTATHTALRCGALTWSKALAISEATRTLPGTAAHAVEAHVLRRAAGQTHKNLRDSLRRQVAKHTTRGDADRHRAAVTERICKIVPLADGMAGLWVVHTADKIQQMWVVIQAIADLAKRETPKHAASPTPNPTATPEPRRDPTPRPDPTSTPPPTTSGPATSGPATSGPATSGPATSGPATSGPATSGPATSGAADSGPEAGVKDERTAEQRRADVVVDLFEQILHNGLDWLGRRLPDQHRRRPHIEVLIPATTLLGLDDDPCDLTGYGPIPAEMARRIATNGTWRRLLTDPTNGTVLEASTTRHNPSTAVTETLLARHPVCAWPGCNRTSRECDRDHATPFAQSGRTSLTGLVPYCEYHHVIKDTPAWGWNTATHPDGSVTLTTPTGHRYTTVPPARGPITQPSQSHPTGNPTTQRDEPPPRDDPPF